MTAQDKTYNKIKKDILSADLTKSFGIKNPAENQITASLYSLLEKYSISYLDKNPKIVISKLIELYPDLKNINIEKINSNGLSFLQKAILLLVVSFVGHLFNGQLFKSDEAKAQEAQQEKINAILTKLKKVKSSELDENIELYET